jgi:TonB family protein
MKSVSHKLRAGLLELRTDQGSMYAKPSFRQRLYLLWIFRNFRSLARPVLTHHQQEFIAKLTESAVALESDALHRPCIIGTIEDVVKVPARKKPAAISASNVVELPTRKPMTLIVPAVGAERIIFPQKQPTAFSRELESAGNSPAPVTKMSAPAEFPARLGNSEPSDDRSKRSPKLNWPRWASAAASIAAFFGVLIYLAQVRTPLSTAGFKVQVAPRPQPAAQTQSRPAETPQPRKAIAALELKTSPTDVAFTAQPKSKAITRAKPEIPRQSTMELDSLSTARVHIPGAPDRGLTYPEAPDPNLKGVVNLRALIAPDGSVRQVTVLDGKRSLGLAAARAVRHWRYRPPDSSGQAVEAETTITFHFVGDDAVSVSFPSSAPLKQN